MMRMLRRSLLVLGLGIGLGLGAVQPSAAQELPTGAARLVEKVQTRIFISQAMLTYHVSQIVANQPALPTAGGE
jgi:hypothetical protein